MDGLSVLGTEDAQGKANSVVESSWTAPVYCEVMPLRFLLILTVLVQQLALPVMLLGAGEDRCTATGCCDVVRTTTCCGEVVEEMQCRKSGGACMCATSSHEPAAPFAPGQDRGDLVSLFIAPPAGSTLEPIGASSVPVRPASMAIRRSHNETRALLCIWRT